METHELEFNNMKEFQSWKAEEEQKTSSEYNRKGAPYSDVNSQIWYYYCNRAGKYKPKGSNIRQMKLQGTCKTGKQCTAHIKVTIKHETSKVKVFYCSSHHNHAIALAHLRMPTATRMKIAAKLQEGVGMDHILDTIRDSVTAEGINREHLVTRTDLYNIKDQYNISSGSMKHKNDLYSVDARIQELKELDYNPVLVYKRQGDQQGPEMDNVSDNDFVLCLQTEFQKDMLKKFGSAIICVDTTHGTNQYDFLLTTLLVVDEFGEGIPCAWMLSNREDVLMLMVFFQAIKDRVGEIKTDFFMSDMAEQFFTAWKAVFKANSTKKLICTWHVDRAWRNGVREHIASKVQQIEVYHQLRILLMESSESEFRVLLQEFLTYIQKNYPRFYTYFRDTYCNKVPQWAACQRQHAPANTNMYLESSHRVLKVVYLHHKQNRRIDHLTTVLLKISRDKAFDRLRKVEIGKSTHRTSEISKRHRNAVKIIQKNSYNLVEISSAKWEVESEREHGKFYTISYSDSPCTNNCKLICNICRICIHQYSCTCLDSILHNTICKHAHLIKIYNNNVENIQPSQSPQSKSSPLQLPPSQLQLPPSQSSPHSAHIQHLNIQHSDIQADTPTYFTHILTKETESELSSLKRRLQSIISELQVTVDQCMNVSTLQAMRTHLQSAATMSRAMNENSSPISLAVKRKIPSTKHPEKQLRFFSTKKKKVCATQGLSKPSLMEMSAQKNKLKKQEPKFCGVCLMENDKYDDDIIDWVQCCLCNVWIHTLCSETDTSTQDYVCQFCQKT